MTSPRRPGIRLFATLLSAFLAASCADETSRLPIEPEPSLAKGGPNAGTPTVGSTNPSFGAQGQQHLSVRVLGSGFNPTAVAMWQRDGVVDLKITVHSTTFISSSEIIADISIAADADTALYDVAVEVDTQNGRKKGVGIELFEVGLTVSLTGGYVATLQPVKAQESADGLTLSQKPIWRFLSSINFPLTLAAGTGPCVPGKNPPTEAEKTELLQLLNDPEFARSFHATVSKTTFPFTGGMFVHWTDAAGTLFYVWAGGPGDGSGTPATVSQSGNVYTYTGGSLFIHRGMRKTGKTRNVTNMICPNLDTVELTFPAVP